jgi:tetraacyldisaccharide 4'-kinase
VLARGHGGRLRGPALVDRIAHGAADVGDEPLLHARDGATWIARDRLAGAQAAVAAGAQAILMDDGFQNPALAKDLSLLVVDARQGFGNGAVLPAGPLREPVAQALKRAQAIILMGADSDGVDQRFGALPVLRAHIEAQGAPVGPLVAFAGIAQPQKFFDALAERGGEVLDAVPFDDHHPYKERDLDFLGKLAADHRARLVTTEKDHVRLPPDARSAILTLPVVARFADLSALDALLDPLFPSHT